MTAKQVETTCWGKPDQVDRLKTMRGTTDRYVYDQGRVILKNGIVTSVKISGTGKPVVFAPLVLTTRALGIATATTAFACALYFWARLAHVVIYTLGIPVLRTLSFAVGFVAQALLVLAIFKLI